MQPKPGQVNVVEDGLRRVLAPNAGPMTHWGTNTFILGEGDVAIIDPGPDDDRHLSALRMATQGEKVTHILVTHAHLDHSPLARRIAQETGAPIVAFGPPDAGRSPIMRELAAAGTAGGGEGVDHQFQPDKTVRDGDVIEGDQWRLNVLHTPGHFAGHLSFQFGDTVISGDHVMEWSSSLVSPPDGDLAAFMETSTRLRDMAHKRLHPAHGAPIEDPADRLGWLITHRESREAEILNTLSHLPQTLSGITEKIYSDIPPAMVPAARRNVLAHLIALHDRNLVSATPNLGDKARFSLR